MPPSKVYTLAEVAQVELTRMRSGCSPTGLPSGLGLERRVPGGIPRDKVTTLFAESGSFKTTVVGAMQLAMALAGHRVLFVTLEDSKELAAHRLLAGESGLAYGAISGGVLDQADVATLAVSDTVADAASRIYVTDDVDPTIEDILDLAGRAVASPKGLDAVFIDYLQYLDGPGDEKSTLTRAIKAGSRFAKVHNCAVVFVSQQKQGMERDTKDPRPKIGDLFGSSSMRMFSKLLLGLFRPYKYYPNPDSRAIGQSLYARFMAAHPEHAAMYPGILEVHLLKNVLGSDKPVFLYVDPPTGVVRNFDNELAPYL